MGNQPTEPPKQIFRRKRNVSNNNVSNSSKTQKLEEGDSNNGMMPENSEKRDMIMQQQQHDNSTVQLDIQKMTKKQKSKSCCSHKQSPMIKKANSCICLGIMPMSEHFPKSKNIQLQDQQSKDLPNQLPRQKPHEFQYHQYHPRKKIQRYIQSPNSFEGNMPQKNSDKTSESQQARNHQQMPISYQDIPNEEKYPSKKVSIFLRIYLCLCPTTVDPAH